MYNLIEDLSKLTTIKETDLEKLVQKSLLCLADDAYLSLVVGKENSVDIDIGIGYLMLKVENNDLKFKFIPSKQFTKLIRNTLVTGTNELDNKIDTLLINRITKVFKDLL